MLYMVIEHFRPWTMFQVREASERGLLDEWMAHWDSDEPGAAPESI